MDVITYWISMPECFGISTRKGNMYGYICIDVPVLLAMGKRLSRATNKFLKTWISMKCIYLTNIFWLRLKYNWNHGLQPFDLLPSYNLFLAGTKQLYEWFSQSVRLSVPPSVTPFWLCSLHRIIMKFSGVITNDRSDAYAKGQVQRSKVKVTEINTQLSCFRTVTPVSIHIWWWNGAYGLMLLSRCAILFFKVIHQISRSHS